MRKEISISILIGLILGLILTYGFYSAKLATSEDNLTKKEEIAGATAGSTETTHSTLIVTSPEDELVTPTGEITITGTATASNFVVLFVDDTPSTLPTDAAGKFTKALTLSKGPHVIAVTAIDENGESSTEERTVIVAPENIEVQPATESAELSPTPTTTKKTATPTPTKRATKTTISATPTPKP